MSESPTGQISNSTLKPDVSIGLSTPNIGIEAPNIIPSVIEDAVTHYLDTGKLTPEELEILRQQKINSLPEERRVRIITTREQLTGNLRNHEITIEEMRTREVYYQEKAQEVDKYSPDVIADYQKMADEKASDRIVFDENFRQTHTKAEEEMWHDAEGGERTEKDPSTQLYTRETLLETLSKDVLEWKETGNVKKLQQIEVMAGDMNNFKQGNDILGHDGFDDFLKKDFAAGFIQLSNYLGSRQYVNNLDLELLEKYFPEGSEQRRRLEQAKGQFVIDLYRLKAGADEIFIKTEYLGDTNTDEERNEQRKLASELINDVYYACIIGRHAGEKGEKQLEEIRKAFEDSPYDFKFEPSDEESDDFSFTKFECDCWNEFGSKLSTLIRGLRLGRPITKNVPECNLRLSAELSSPHTLAEGIESYQTGINFLGERIDTVGGRARAGVGLLDQNGQKDPAKVQQFQESVRHTVINRLTSVGATSQKEVGNIVRKAAADKFSGLLLQLTMQECEEKSKPDGKRNLIVRAWTGTPGDMQSAEDAYNMGSLLNAGRLKNEMSDQIVRRQVYEQTLNHYVKRINEEMSKLSGYFKDNVGSDPKLLLHSALNGSNPVVDKNILYFYLDYQTFLAMKKESYVNIQTYMKNKKGIDLPDRPVYLPELPVLPEGISMNDIRFLSNDELIDLDD